MTRWEYRAIVVSPGESVYMLQREGVAGWEAFGVEPHADLPATTFWLKRPLPDATPRGLSGRLAAAGYPGGEEE